MCQSFKDSKAISAASFLLWSASLCEEAGDALIRTGQNNGLEVEVVAAQLEVPRLAIRYATKR
jgi:hypothetical protein